jgi:membrane fusion protein (multidrug efflux system)
MRTAKQKRARRWFWLAPAALVLIAAGLYFSGQLPFGWSAAQANGADSTKVAGTDSTGDKASDGEPEEVPVPVEVARVERRSIASYYRAASVIEADRLVDMVAKVTGRVQILNVEEGDWVADGQVLAELENGRERIRLRQGELKLEEQRRLLERNQAMVKEGLISEQEFDDVKHAFDLAESDRDLARIALEETIIRAPFSGQVTDRKIVKGQNVPIGVALFTLGDFEPLRIRVHLPEAVARKVREGQRVLVSPEGMATPLTAVVERVAPVVDPATSTVRLTLRLEEGGEVASVGGFVKVRITTDTHHEALAIPKLALVEEGGLRSVFVAEADTVRKTEIATGLYDETHIEVLDGLNPSCFVVTLGQGGLRTGSRIEVLNAEQAGWSPGASTLTGGDALAAQIPRALDE